jgi:hypothetical protein
MGLLSKLVQKAFLKSKGRRDLQKNLKKGFISEKKDKGQYKNDKQQLEKDATSFARREADKLQGKTETMERVNVAQGRNRKFQAKGETKGQTDLPALRKRSLETGSFTKSNKESTANLRRQTSQSRLRMGEKAFDKAVKKAVVDKTKKPAGAVATGVLATRAVNTQEDKKSTRSRDTRVNPSDFPMYKKGTKSAAAFRKAYRKAEREGKKTFTFESRSYRVETVKKKLRGK